MKTILPFKNLAFLFIFLIISTICFSQNISDTEWKFKLDVPSSWTKNNYMDGIDKVYDFYSSDQNAAVQLRIINVNAQLSYNLLIPFYEKNILSAATRIDLQDITFRNGISGKQAIYSMNYIGTNVDIAVFYTLQNSKAYMFSAMVASSIAENYRNDIQSITASFTIDGFNAPIAKQDENPSSLGGLMGGAQNNNSSGDCGLGKKEVIILGNGMNGTYNFVKGYCFPISWNKITTIHGLNEENQLMLELYLYNYKGTGKFTNASNNRGFRISTVNRVGVGGSDDSSTGELKITEYNVGGVIKGNFNAMAMVNGRSIKGSLSLSPSTSKRFLKIANL